MYAGSPPPKGLVIDGDEAIELVELTNRLAADAAALKKLVKKHLKKY